MIVVAVSTVMDGLVIRWFRDLDAALNGHGSVMTASRNGVMVSAFLHEIPAAHMTNACRAYEHLRRDRPGCEDFPRSLASHRRKGLFGPLEPIAAPAEPAQEER